MAVCFCACCAESALFRLVSLVAESELGWERQARFEVTAIMSCVPVVAF